MGPKGVGYYVDSPDTGRLLGEKPLELGEDHGPTSVRFFSSEYSISVVEAESLKFVQFVNSIIFYNILYRV